MRTALEYLPAYKKEQIMHIANIIKEAVCPEKIILFGSYAKGNWTEHRYTGKDGILYEYISDFDFLVVTKKNKMKESTVRDIVNSKTEHYKQPINLLVHEIDYINEGLAFGQYFFTDIIKEGVLLYDTDIVHFIAAKEQTPAEAKAIAQRYYDIWFSRGGEFLIDTDNAFNRESYNKAAFELHQATESFYYTLLLVFTGYKLKTHNLFKLRKQAKQLSEELFLLFAVETNKEENHLFDLLKRGYIEARYEADYSITPDELTILMGRIKKMQEIVERTCKEKIDSFLTEEE